MTVRTSLAAAALLALAACGGTTPGGVDAGPTPGSDAGSIPVGSDAGATRADTLAALTGVAATGKNVFQYGYCDGCHQPDGRGTAPNFPALNTAAKTWTKLQFFTLLLEGKGQMPSYKMLQDQELADVVEYVRTTFNK